MGGTNKLVATVDGLPMVRQVARTLLELPLVDRVVVTGAEAGGVHSALAGLELRFVHNPHHEEGIASSIRTGVAALDPTVDGAFIVLGDMPRVGRDDLERVLRSFDPAGGRGICVPVCGTRRGNPVLWASRYFPELLTLTGDTGGRRLFERFTADLHEVPVEGEGVLLDIDTPDSLKATRARER